MFYHVRITTKSDRRLEVKLDLSEEILLKRFLTPYENNDIMIVNGKTIEPNDIDRIRINRTREGSAEILPIVKWEREVNPKKTPGISNDWYIADKGEEVTDFFIQGPPGYKKTKSDKQITESVSQNDQIFIVHGHDEEMKQTVARTLEKLGLKPIILHEQPNQGRTIIKKFTDYANNVSFAVILLSPDDKGYRKDQSSEASKFRARQNVILELGYFLGKLGRNNVAALFKNDPNFELPTDYEGVLYTPFDNSSRWQLDLIQELKSAGYNVDANKLV